MQTDQKQMAAPGLMLEVVVFACGALVMIFEIVGSRIVAPFLGSSTYIWTSLIGVILGALSLGYWLGGKAADSDPRVSRLATAIFFAASLISLTVLIRDFVLIAMAGIPVPLELKAVTASLILFAPASVALGFVIPYATRLRITSVDNSGNSVGRLYALSTIGSIVGTFAAGFILLPFVGSTRTLYLVAGILFVLSLILAPYRHDRSSIAGFILLILGIAGSELLAYHERVSNGVTDIDTEYSRIRAFNMTDRYTGRPMRAMATDPYSIQSAVFLDGDDLALEYTNYYSLAGWFAPSLERTLMIGGAGYSFPKEHLRIFPEARIDVVELDPAVTDLARREFRLVEDQRLMVIHEDGRTYLNRYASESYDVIMIDAFGSLFSVPFHLTTREATAEMHRVLNGDGIAIVNVGSAVSGPASGFFRAQLATYKDVFSSVKVFKVRPDFDDKALQNIILIAFKGQPNARADQPEKEITKMLAAEIDVENLAAETILTDDLAPVEYFSSVAHQTGRQR